MYNRLVEKCFKDCVDSFRRKNLDSNEERVREREREREKTFVVSDSGTDSVILDRSCLPPHSA